MLSDATSDNKMSTNPSNESSSNKNTILVDEENPSIPKPTEHQTLPSKGMYSPSAPNPGKSQDKPSGPGLPQISRESQQQKVDGQRESSYHCRPQHVDATTVASYLNTCNNNSSDPIPSTGSQHMQSNPDHKAQSPVLLQQKTSPLHDAVSQSCPQQISDSSFPHIQNGHQQNEQQQILHKQKSQATQSNPPHCHAQSSPQQINQNTQAHNSLLSPRPVAQNTTPSPQQSRKNSPAQPGPPQTAPVTSLPLGPPPPLLSSQRSPANHGDQRPSEPTNRPDTESTSGPPHNPIMKSGPPNGVYKHQDFSPNHHQTMLVGNNQGILAQRGLAPTHNTAMPLHSERQVNRPIGLYGLGNHQHLHLNQANMNRPMPPSAHHTYHTQTINPLHSTSHHPTYQQQGGTGYSYHMGGQQHPQAHPNMYPSHHYQQQHYYQQLHPQAQGYNQGNSRGNYPPEEWNPAHYQPRHLLQPSAYPPVASARGSGQLKENNMSPLCSEGSSGASLVCLGSVLEVGVPTRGPDDGKGEGREASGHSSDVGSLDKNAHKDNSEQPESPKEILDLDSHNAASRHRSTQPRQPPPTTTAHAMSGFMYDPRAVHPGMQQGGVPPPHMMSQAHGGTNGAPYPGQPQPDPGRYAAQRPHPHLIEALQQPQQLPYSPGQTRMALYRHPQPAGPFQSMMIQQRGLLPEHLLHPG